jgi:hypothetical protein
MKQKYQKANIEIATPPGVTLTLPSPIKGEGYMEGRYNGGWPAMTNDRTGRI